MPRTMLKPKTTTSTIVPEMDDRELAQVLSIGRLGIGLALFVAPSRALRAWTGDEDPSFGARMAARGLGARDMAIAIGTLVALDARGSGGAVRGWIEAGVMADASDTVGALVQWRDLPRLRRLLALFTSGGAVILGLRLAEALDD
ncbi:MAG: hypothetical protein ACRDKZ_12625 [Actinomycetota bacterium]